MREALSDLRAAVAVGARRTLRYPGAAASTYAAQLVISLVPAALVFAVVAAKLAAEPALDRAVEGDLASALVALRAVPSAPLVALIAMALAALAYVVISWFLVAGLLGVYLRQPEGRRETARCFGAAGAARFFAFARLFAMVAPLYAALGAWALVAAVGVADRLPELVSAGAVVRAALSTLSGPAAITWLLWTAVDHARVELSADADLGAWRALRRGVTRVVTRPVCALHTGAGHLAALLLGGLAWAAGDLALGAAGLLLARQLHAIGRHAVHLSVLAGQVELGERVRRSAS